MSPRTRLLLIRHGEVETRYERVFGGVIDMGLSPRGLEQAARLAEHLEGEPVAAVYASPLRRAQQTAGFLLDGHGRPLVTMPELREVDFGAWTGLRWDEVRERFGVSAFDWLQELDRGRIPGAEPVAGFQARVGRGQQRILEGHPGQTVAVVCHGGVIRMWLALQLGLPLPKLGHFEFDYASVTEISCRAHRDEVQLLNFRPWAGPA